MTAAPRCPARRGRASAALMVAALWAAGACGGPRASNPEATSGRSGEWPPAGLPGQWPPSQWPERPASDAPVPAPEEPAEPGVLSCPSPRGASSAQGWAMSRDGRLCCAPRYAGYTPSWPFEVNIERCLDALAPGLSTPKYVDHPVERTAFQEVVRFERGADRIVVGEVLDNVVKVLADYPSGSVTLVGTTRCGEVPSEAAAAQLAQRRASAVRRELERRGVPASRIVVGDRGAFTQRRLDLSNEQRLLLVDSPSVILFSSPEKPRAVVLIEDRCLSGVTAKLTLPAAELRGSRLTIEACHAGRCATARVSLRTLAAEDRVVFALDGPLGAGAFLALKQPRAELEVGTVVEAEEALAPGDSFSLRVQVDDRLVGRLGEPLTYARQKPHPGSRAECLQARVRAHVSGESRQGSEPKSPRDAR
ncbi:OmpA family protein [Sorangium sp. So ce233]|uniref:OmpA family protein n=1 Tax=Sorangium sp. So ce233 TaxID=3133290 RepID=UPI003F5FD8C4